MTSEQSTILLLSWPSSDIFTMALLNSRAIFFWSAKCDNSSGFQVLRNGWLCLLAKCCQSQAVRSSRATSAGEYYQTAFDDDSDLELTKHRKITLITVDMDGREVLYVLFHLKRYEFRRVWELWPRLGSLQHLSKMRINKLSWEHSAHPGNTVPLSIVSM